MSPHPPDRIIDETRSLCSRCGAKVPALIIEREGKVYQRPKCEKHEVGDTLVFSDSGLYHRLDEWNKLAFPSSEDALTSLGNDEDCECGVANPHTPSLAVIDITNRCNFCCPVCFAEATSDDDFYFLDREIVRKMLESLLCRSPIPCRHVQFSGGEPTLHPEFPEILRMARDMGFTHIQVATNGSRFTDGDYVALCEEMGLHTLYLQFDGVRDEVYEKLRGRRLLDKKIAIVNNIAKTNLRIVLVPTIAVSVNVDQIGPIFRFALQHSKHITGISFQPLSRTGRVEINGQEEETFDLATMATEFSKQTGLTRVPDDWFPLNTVSMIARGISTLRGDQLPSPVCDAHCSLGTYFHIDEQNKPTCVSHFFDLDRFLKSMAEISATGLQRELRQRISQIKSLKLLSDCYDERKAPEELTFGRLLRGLDGWEDKSVGRAADWAKRGFNGMFVAGMHFMDQTNYNFRRLGRCIIKYVTTKGEVISFCGYNAGARHRTVEEAIRKGEYRSA